MREFELNKVCANCKRKGVINRRFRLHDGEIKCCVCSGVVGEYNIDYDELSHEPDTRKHLSRGEIYKDNNGDEQ